MLDLIENLGCRVHRHQAAEEDDAHDHVVIAVHHGIVVEQTHAVDIEDLLDEERACEHERADFGKARGNRDKRIAERMTDKCLVKVQALRQGGTHVIAAQFLQRRVFHEEREEREFTNHVAENRERQMLRQVEHLTEKAEVFEIVAREAAQRENIEVRATSQENDEQNAKRITRHHVARKNESRRNGIELAAVMNRLPQSKRNADKVAQEERCHAKEQRNRKTAHDDIPHGESVRVAFTEIQVQYVP